MRRMRLGLTVAALASVVVAFVRGATPVEAQGWSFGLVAGANATRMTFEDATAQQRALARPGGHAGLLIEARATSRLTVRSGFLYSQKGFDSDDFGKLELAYLEVPAVLDVGFELPLAPHLFAGVAWAREIRCHASRLLAFDNLGCDHALTELARAKTDVGLVVGGGIRAVAGRGVLSFDLWLSEGLRDINREALPPGSVRNRALLLSVGYWFRRGGLP